MSLNDILNTANTGLAAAQAGLGSVSNNISNAGVAGYARERTPVSTLVAGGKTGGVVVGQPERVADSFLENAVYRRGGDMGRSEVVSDYLDRLQSLLGAPSSAGGLANRLDAIQAAAAALTGVQGAQTVANFTGNIQDALDGMRQLDGEVENLRSDAETQVGDTVDRINVLLRQINDLNKTISSSVNSSTTGAENRRTAALEELSGLMQVTVRNQPDGRVTIETSSGQMLLDKRLRQLSYRSSDDAPSQAVYPDIDIRFVEPDATTGNKIDSSAIGGKLGGLIDLRDRALPQFNEQLGQLFSGLAESLNRVSNENTSVPPPASLEGRPTGLVGADAAHFTGKAIFAVVDADGKLVSKQTVDFDALPADATIDDVVAAVNGALGTNGTATLTDGVLKITANGTGNGIVVAQDPTDPSSRAGVGFSQFFGLNDVVRSDDSTLAPSGLTGDDLHGFDGQTAEVTLRDASGRIIASHTMTGSEGPKVSDLVDELNGSPLGGYGSFALDDKGRMIFTPNSGSAGATISIPSDSTNRLGTGRTFSSLFGLTGDAGGLNSAGVRADILGDPGRMPLARLQLDVPVGGTALGPGDLRGANAFVDRLANAADFGKDGATTIASFASKLLGKAGADAATAQSDYEDASARRVDAQTRRDNFAGVNVDEELSQMVVLQNSYTAAARIITTASEMYETLVSMV